MFVIAVSDPSLTPGSYRLLLGGARYAANRTFTTGSPRVVCATSILASIGLSRQSRQRMRSII